MAEMRPLFDKKERRSMMIGCQIFWQLFPRISLEIFEESK